MTKPLDLCDLLAHYLQTMHLRTRYLDSVYNNNRSVSPTRANDCICLENYKKELESYAKLVEQEESKIIEEIEVALRNAALIRSECDSLTGRPKKLPKVNETPHVSVDKITTTLPEDTSKASRNTSNRPIPGARKSTKVLKPVYQNAPYKTEIVKPKRGRSKFNASGNVRTEKLMNTNATSNLPLDQRFTANQQPVTENSKVVAKTNLTSSPPSATSYASSDQNISYPEFKCTCVQGQLKENLKYLESVEKRLLFAVKNIDFCSMNKAAEQFIPLLHTKNLEHRNWTNLHRSVTDYYARFDEMLDRFIEVLTVLDLSDSSQNGWLISMFHRFIKIRRLLEMLHLHIDQVSPGNEQDHSSTPPVDDDPLGAWLSRSNDSTQFNKPPTNPLQYAYLSAGPSLEGMPSRLFSLTSTPRLITLEGTSHQLEQYLDLWDELENEHFKTQLLTSIDNGLLNALNQSGAPPSVSEFRELYGLACSSYPVALKESFVP